MNAIFINFSFYFPSPRSQKGGTSSAEASEDSQGSDSETDDDIDSLSDWAELTSLKPITTVSSVRAC